MNAEQTMHKILFLTHNYDFATLLKFVPEFYDELCRETELRQKVLQKPYNRLERAELLRPPSSAASSTNLNGVQFLKFQL